MEPRHMTKRERRRGEDGRSRRGRRDRDVESGASKQTFLLVQCNVVFLATFRLTVIPRACVRDAETQRVARLAAGPVFGDTRLRSPHSLLLLACPTGGPDAPVSGFLADAWLNIFAAAARGRLHAMVFDPVPRGNARAFTAALRRRFAGRSRLGIEESSEAEAVVIMLARRPLPHRPALALAQRRARGRRQPRSSSNHPTTPTRSRRSASPSTMCLVEPGRRRRRSGARSSCSTRSTCSSSPRCRCSPPCSSATWSACDQHPPQLPARIVGADPPAHERGVKLIGATAHYVT